MAEQVTNYQCPACTGPLHYVGASGMLECDYCGSKFDVAQMAALQAGAEAQAAENQAKAEAEARAEADTRTEWDTSGLEQWDGEEGLRSYSCPSCGAQLICDGTTVATSCPYCGNPTVVPGQFSGGWKPNCIIPFKLDRQAAVDALKSHYKGKRLLPDGFASGNRVEELKGVYVPFWLYDGRAHADMTFDARNTNTYTRGDYVVTETRHYVVRRAGTVPFEMIPVDASSKMPDAHMDAIEPYDYSELREFSSAYLPGFLADKYDLSAEECARRADERAANTALAAMRADVGGYSGISTRSQQVELRRDRARYGLLPVYLLGTVWEGKQYLFAMNGQTGKLIGDLPVDRGKYWKWFGGITAGVTAVLGTLLLLIL